MNTRCGTLADPRPHRNPAVGTAAGTPGPVRAAPRRVRKDARRASWRVLAYPDFRLYFIATTASNGGTWLNNTAVALLAFGLTHSVLWVGIVACAQFCPVLVLGPWAGRAVARRSEDLQGLLIVTQIVAFGAAGALAGLQAAGLLNKVGLAAGAFTLGLAYCFSLPAFTLLVPTLVEAEDTRHAMAMNSVSYNIGRACAPLLAIVVVTTLGFAWAFAANAVSFLVLAAALRRVQPRCAGRPSSQAKVMDGFRVAVKDRSIWLLLTMVAVVTIAADPVLVLGPALAHHFDVSRDWAGYFLSVLGIGTILGSLVPMRSPQRLRIRHAIYPLTCLGVAIVVFSLGVNLWLCLAMTLIAGMACLQTGAITQTLLLGYAGPARAATVMAVWAVAWAGSKPLASLADGMMATFVSVRMAGVLLAAPALLPVIALAVSEAFRRRYSRDQPEAAAGGSLMPETT